MAVCWQGNVAQSVSAASMERRPGPEYAFCDPLLLDALPRVGDGQVLPSLLAPCTSPSRLAPRSALVCGGGGGLMQTVKPRRYACALRACAAAWCVSPWRLTVPWAQSDVILSLMFLLPGTHAGPQGDIDQICAAALEEAGLERRVVKTRLVGELEGLVPLLARRFSDAVARLPGL